ncbi:MAG: sigma-70 family RNA polymerase sigma factor [Polyangiaceae bacterium]|nr:sigma-70 family RNA polymerase sigma factor [Polyangiaceae bacterium]
MSLEAYCPVSRTREIVALQFLPTTRPQTTMYTHSSRSGENAEDGEPPAGYTEGASRDHDLNRAFHTIYESHIEFTIRTLRRLGVRECDIDDVAQEVFLAVRGALQGSDRTRPVRPWLFGFVMRHAANYRRLARHRCQQQLGNEDAPACSRLDARLDAKREVERVMRSLDENKRTVLALYDIEGLSAAEIASLLEIPTNTVYSRIRVAREEFRQRVAAELVPSLGAQDRDRPEIELE